MVHRALRLIAFLLPTVERLAARAGTLPRGVHAIVLSPTRELAAQIELQCAALIKHHRPLLSSHAVLGGTAVKLDVQRLRKMGGGDGKTRKALEAAASATSDQAMGLRRSMSPKEKRDAKRGDE